MYVAVGKPEEDETPLYHLSGFGESLIFSLMLALPESEAFSFFFFCDVSQDVTGSVQTSFSPLPQKKARITRPGGQNPRNSSSSWMYPAEGLAITAICTLHQISQIANDRRGICCIV